MRLAGQATPTVLLAAFVLFILISAAGLDPVTRLVPMVVAVPTLAVIMYQLRRDLRNQRQPDAQTPPSSHHRSAILLILLLPAMLLLLGILLAIPVHTMIFLRIRGRESWPRSVAIATAAGGVIYTLSLLTSKPELTEVPIWRWLGSP